ncbi:transposase [Streptomyces sp. NPDC059742]|uniref:transposase n=1 Tax=Streptomyces sp. NPDC059742 TaxID=3346927 RepID=UPI00365CA71B
MAKPCDQARCLQALPRPAVAGGLHQRLEALGGDQRTGLPGRLRQRSRLRQPESAWQAQPVGPRPPSARAVTRWILSHPEDLAEGDRLQLKVVLANCHELDALAGHVRSFAHTLTQLQGHQVPAWIEAATTADLPSLQRFARHLERDLDAVTAGLSLPWNSGVVEGHVNRIKMLKRQMFGRAGFELLRSASCFTRDTRVQL